MEINRATLDKIAHLARLEFGEEEALRMMADMTEIVTWVEKLKEVDTTGVEPLTSMSQEINAFRSDEAKPGLSREEALSRAPSSDGTYFKVPKMIE